MELTLIKYGLRAIVLVITIMTAVHASPVRPYTDHNVYFEGSDYELNVYKVYGRRNGNTIFILGGIQGDEPGGFLSADLYAGLRLEQGNLIIIPRANLKSIILFNRGIEGDMNRLFVDNNTNTSTEQQVVKVIMSYMSEADLFLNMHDGWGFHNPVHINEQRNPKRFGQCIIVDADEHECGNKIIDLKRIANDVLDNVNARISNAEHYLAYFNTRTGTPDTPWKEMQKTATWYALRHYCIPAFGIESSKNITSLELRILYHNYAVNEFMKLMDIIPENPPVYVTPAVLDYVLVTVNGESLTARNGDVIRINKDDVISVKHIETNHERGVTCEVLGFGNLNSLKREVVITHSTKIVFRKESAKFAEISIEVEKLTPNTVKTPDGYIFYVTVDDKVIPVNPDVVLTVKTGSRLKILRLEYNGKNTGLPINLRGWVPRGITVNNGDDRGYVFTVNQAEMIARWSIDGDGITFPVTADSDGKELARFYIRIE